ncbi:MAG: hypothetical protein NTW32_18935 [Chloroflexi bacterium]|nr:hypothetical protein [Chloroflexota bacterium]
MSIKINIGEVLSKAWQIVWKFKVLWIFGILAGCSANNGSRFNFNGNSAGSGSGGSGGPSGSGQIPDFFRQYQNMQPEQIMSNILGQYTAIIVGVLLLLCVLWIVFYFLGVMGVTGLIKGANKADAGATSMSFGELWTESTPYFWRMFGLNFLVGLPFFILVVILVTGLGLVGYSTFKAGTPDVGMSAIFIGLLGLFFGALCVISILSIIVNMIVVQAQNAIVLEDLGVLAGLIRGWSVLKSAVLTVIVIAIILGVLGGIVGFVIAIPIIIIAVPAALSMAFTAGSGGFLVPLLIGAGCFIIYLPVLLVLSGILQAYNQSVWTLVYRRLTALPAPALVEASSAQ